MSIGRQPLDIRVDGQHVDIVLNGKILAHSEEYSSVSKANRAADMLEEAILTRQLRVRARTWVNGEWVNEVRVASGVRLPL